MQCNHRCYEMVITYNVIGVGNWGAVELENYFVLFVTVNHNNKSIF